MNTTKLVGFLQGAFYSLVPVVLAYVVNNVASLGLSATLTLVIGTVASGLLSIYENKRQDITGRALFGLAR